MIIITKVKGLRKWRNKPLKVSQIGSTMATSVAAATRIRSLITDCSNFLVQRPALTRRLSPQESIRMIQRLSPLLIEVLTPLQPFTGQVPLDWYSRHRDTPPWTLVRHKFSKTSWVTRLCDIKIGAKRSDSNPTRWHPKVLQSCYLLQFLRSWSKPK